MPSHLCVNIGVVWNQGCWDSLGRRLWDHGIYEARLVSVLLSAEHGVWVAVCLRLGTFLPVRRLKKNQLSKTSVYQSLKWRWQEDVKLVAL